MSINDKPTPEEVAELVKTLKYRANEKIDGLELRVLALHYKKHMAEAAAMLERLQAENKSAGDAGLVVTDAMVEAAEDVYWDGAEYACAMRKALEAALSLAPQNSASTGLVSAPFTEGRGAAKVASPPVLAGDWVMVPRVATDAMLDAASDAELFDANKCTIADHWDAMIAAAPKPPAPVPLCGFCKDTGMTGWEKPMGNPPTMVFVPQPCQCPIGQARLANAPVPLTDEALRVASETLAKQAQAIKGCGCCHEIGQDYLAKLIFKELRRVSQHAPAHQPSKGA